MIFSVHKNLRSLIGIATVYAMVSCAIAAEPPLPSGLGGEKAAGGKVSSLPASGYLPFELSGFWESRVGVRTQEDPNEKDMSIAETRLQLEMEKGWENVTLRLTSDLLYDSVLDEHDVNIEEGEGLLDLREASMLIRAAEFLDIKIGRQTLTWGTGDLLFINDLFPKDWNSFFIGRDDEYLKAPSDAVKLSFFTGIGNFDMVYTPRFDADRFINGQRISYYNCARDQITGRNAIVRVERPDGWLDDDELALRLYRNLRGYELDVYAYRGFWKSPAGTDPVNRRAIFPELSVFGASIRGALRKGIAHLEFGYYDSEEDRDGEDPLIRNAESRLLVGYEQEIGSEFTGGVQWYVEHMHDHKDYKHSLPSEIPQKDRNRQVVTLRLNKLLMNQNLKLTIFIYYSPTDEDAHLRPKVNYKLSDHLTAEIGGNVFLGEKDHTFFGQFKKNNNVYAGLRIGFFAD